MCTRDVRTTRAISCSRSTERTFIAAVRHIVAIFCLPLATVMFIADAPLTVAIYSFRSTDYCQFPSFCLCCKGTFCEIFEKIHFFLKFCFRDLHFSYFFSIFASRILYWILWVLTNLKNVLHTRKFIAVLAGLLCMVFIHADDFTIVADAASSVKFLAG